MENYTNTDILLNNILYFLKSKGISEKECLIRSNISTSFFSDWKASRLKNPTFDKIFRISQTLEVSIDTLLSSEKVENTSLLTHDLSPDEYNLLHTYRTMDETGKKLLQDELKYLWAEHHDLSDKKNDQK